MWHFGGRSSEACACVVNTVMTSVSLSRRPATDLVACPQIGPGPVGFLQESMVFVLIFSFFLGDFLTYFPSFLTEFSFYNCILKFLIAL